MTVPHLLSGGEEDTSAARGSFQYRPESDETLLAGKRVVVVEDEGIVQMHLRRLLTRAGMHVVSYALNGVDGAATALRDRPDLVVMDINMPGAIDGLEAARRILAEYRVCIVMVTAYSTYREQAKQLGASGYLTKPVESVTLLPELRRAWIRFQNSTYSVKD